jgi:hypothetical protein
VLGKIFASLTCLFLISTGVSIPAMSQEKSSLSEPDSISIVRVDGSSSSYVTIQFVSGGFVRAAHGDGKVEFIPVHEVRSIQGPGGQDLTDRVLIEGKSIPGPPPRVAPPTAPSTSSRSPGSPTLRGRPLPWKKGFPIIQGGLLFSVDGGDEDSGGIATAEFGYMRNLSAEVSLGVTFSLVGDSDYIRLGLKPRFRKWVTNTTSLDFGAGLYTSIEKDLEEPDFDDDVHWGAGFVAEVSLSLGDWVAITTLAEVSKVKDVTFDDYLGRSVDTRTDMAMYFGLKAGGEPGIPASIFMGLVALAAREFADMR